jgi:putative RecB family exonuclease
MGSCDVFKSQHEVEQHVTKSVPVCPQRNGAETEGKRIMSKMSYDYRGVRAFADGSDDSSLVGALLYTSTMRQRVKYYSHSSLSAYEQCPHRYKLAYVDRLPRRKESIAYLKGAAAHYALESIYQEVLAGRLPLLDDLLLAMRKWWDARLREGYLLPAGGGKPEDYLLGAEMSVRNYYARHYPFDEDETVALERKVTANLDASFGIVGYIDRLVRRNGQYEIHDFKTSTRVARHGSVFSDRQLGLYALGLGREIPEARSVRLVWHYVFLDEVRSSQYSEAELNQLQDGVLKLIERIESDRDYPKSVSALCNWCDFCDVCQPNGDGHSVKEIPIAADFPSAYNPTAREAGMDGA